MSSFHWGIKSGGKGSARQHASYITRRGSHAQRKDLITAGYGNLPEWAQDSPESFWRAADNNERRNGAAYREVVVALPNELTTAQNVELVNRYVQELTGSKPYQYAVHRPAAALGEVPQPHAHIMFSDRVPDGVARSEQQHFRRYNPVYPELGGCRKDSGGKTPIELRDEVIARRARWAALQNEALARHGHTVTVDHRSRAERGLAPATERHLGPAGVQTLTPEAKEALLAGRAG